MFGWRRGCLGGGPRVGAVGESVTDDGDILHHPKWPGGLYCILIWFRQWPWGAYSEDSWLMSAVDSIASCSGSKNGPGGASPGDPCSMSDPCLKYGRQTAGMGTHLPTRGYARRVCFFCECHTSNDARPLGGVCLGVCGPVPPCGEAHRGQWLRSTRLYNGKCEVAPQGDARKKHPDLGEPRTPGLQSLKLSPSYRPDLAMTLPPLAPTVDLGT